MAIRYNRFDSERFVSLFELWGRKNPSYEKHFEDEVIKRLCDFGKGTNETSDSKAKVLGAGYEVLIMAFFIGLPGIRSFFTGLPGIFLFFIELPKNSR